MNRCTDPFPHAVACKRTSSARPAASSLRDRGFTLVELLVVMTVLGILAAIAIPSYLRHRERGMDVAVATDLRNAAIAQEAFVAGRANGQFWATSVTQLQELGFRPSSPRVYYGGSFAMALGGVGREYCLTARSASGRYLGYSSDRGPVAADARLDPDRCLP